MSTRLGVACAVHVPCVEQGAGYSASGTEPIRL